MSRYLARLSPDRILRRRVTVGGVDLVLHLRVAGGGDGRPEMAIGRVGQRRRSLQWRSIADVATNAFALDVGLLYGRQLQLMGDDHA